MKHLLTKRTLLIAVAAAFLLVAWNREINLLYGIFALIASTIILSHLLPRFALRGVSASRTLNPTAFEGDALHLKVSVENRSWRSRFMLEVLDSIPAAPPGSRNPMTFLAKLPARKERNYSYSLTCYKRGEYDVGPLTVQSAYPLGISTTEKELPQSRRGLLVYPQIFEIPRVRLRGGGNRPLSGVEAISQAGAGEEFWGVREYKRGDDLRYIHWPSTAKHRRLIVKEFEIRASTEVTILLDLHKDSDVGEGKETTLEYAVKIAASMAKTLLEKGHVLQLVGYGRKNHIVPYTRGLNQLQKVLEELARVKADGTMPYPRAICQSSDLLRDGGAVILLFSRLDFNTEEALYAVRLLRAKRIRPLCVMIDHNSFIPGRMTLSSETDPFVEDLTSEGIPIYFISKGDSLPEIFTA